MTMLAEGEMAPDFTVTLDDGSAFMLSDERGHPVVLYFYPEDGTTGCTTQAQEFSTLKLAFEALGSRLVGVSPNTVEDHRKFKARYGLMVELAADPERLAVEAFGVWQLKKLYGREFMGVVRTSFLIGADGRKMLEAAEAHVSAESEIGHKRLTINENALRRGRLTSPGQ
jgi:peroxiredoxin Q/BCP